MRKLSASGDACVHAHRHSELIGGTVSSEAPWLDGQASCIERFRAKAAELQGREARQRAGDGVAQAIEVWPRLDLAEAGRGDAGRYSASARPNSTAKAKGRRQ